MIAQRTPHEHMPKWPADCFDDRPLQPLTVPPGNRKVMTCGDFPDCGCEGDCELPPIKAAAAPERVLMIVLLALMVAGIGLIWCGLR